jgi:polysaccharide pyruvyl transferase CsaB
LANCVIWVPKSNPFNHPQWVRPGCRVFLVGYYGYGNFGDAWLRRIALRWLKQEGIDSVACLWPKSRYDKGVQYVNRWSMWAVIRAVWASNGIVYAGGSVFQDRTSRRSVWYYAAILCLAKCLNRPVWLWGQGLGPLTSSSRWLLTRLAPRQLMVDCRDAESYQLACRLWPHAQCEHGDDLSSLDGCPMPIPSVASSPPIFGLSVRRGCPAAVFSWCQAQGSVQMIQTQASYESDLVCDLNAYLGCTHSDTILDWPAVSKALAGVQGVVSMRYHVLVVAHRLGIRCMGVSSDPKIQSFCMAHGYPWVSDIDVSCAKLEAAWQV